jgi:alpha-methylacyl-CoA racemase
MRARNTFVDLFDVVQPAPAPRFSRTPGAIRGPAPARDEGGADLAARWVAGGTPEDGTAS